MKIALVLSRPPGYSETFLNNKIRFLIQKGIEVELYVDAKDNNFNLCKQFSIPKLKASSIITAFLLTLIKHPFRLIRFLTLEIKGGNGTTEIFKNIYTNLHLLNAHRLDWIHFGFATLTVGRENIASAIKTKMAVSIRGYDISRFPLRYPHVYDKMWNKIDKVHTISDALATKAFKLGLPTYKQVVKITPAIDITKFKNNSIHQNFSSPIRFTTVARLHWSKGLEYTLESLSILNKQGINFIYTIVGDGPDLERLVFAAHQLNLKDKIKFIGKVEHEEIYNHLRDTDVYLQYSVQEGFCNAVLEAQAMGLLCVVSDAEGLGENVVHGYSGWVVPRRSPDLLAVKIIEIINTEKNLLFQIRQQANHRVQESFNLKKQATEFVNFYTG